MRLDGTIEFRGTDKMLDIEEILQQFELIEQKVEQVVQVRLQLQQENRDLANRIQQLENRIQEKIEAEKRHEELTTLIRSKIDGLISRLEGTAEE
jgi:cell division septum initiation protein DivIVA